MNPTLYQTLEDRQNPDYIEQNGPFLCNRNTAWLGIGYYFWDADIEIGHWWGQLNYGLDNYIICSANAIVDNSCWDLHNDEKQRKEFREACRMVAEKRKKPLESLKVWEIIEFLKLNKLLKYKAIRATGINSIGTMSAKNSQIFRVKFINKSISYLDLLPPTQVCLVEKRALSLKNYVIVYPDIYISPFA